MNKVKNKDDKLVKDMKKSLSESVKLLEKINTKIKKNEC